MTAESIAILITGIGSSGLVGLFLDRRNKRRAEDQAIKATEIKNDAAQAESWKSLLLEERAAKDAERKRSDDKSETIRGLYKQLDEIREERLQDKAEIARLTTIVSIARCDDMPCSTRRPPLDLNLPEKLKRNDSAEVGH